MFTTIANWRQPWRDVSFKGKPYGWSKDREFLKVLDLPARTGCHARACIERRRPGHHSAARSEWVAGPGRLGPLSRARPLPPVPDKLAGGVHRCQGTECAVPFRMVQRQKRDLPRGGAAGGDAGHCFRGRASDRRGASALLDARRGSSRDRGCRGRLQPACARSRGDRARATSTRRSCFDVSSRISTSPGRASAPRRPPPFPPISTSPLFRVARRFFR